MERISTCCPDINEDFAADFYYSGKYKMDSIFLSLTYDSKMLVYYIKETEKPNSDTLISTHHIELEKSDLVSEK